ncbi:MAG: hypothetical protein ACPG4X_16430 [Pikeienuella sp.]
MIDGYSDWIMHNGEFDRPVHPDAMVIVSAAPGHSLAPRPARSVDWEFVSAYMVANDAPPMVKTAGRWWQFW